jgi:peptide/nickel transport system permease protein
MLTGDFGTSEIVARGRRVGEVVSNKWANTVVLTGMGLLLAIALSIPVGILSALRPNSKLDHAFTFLSLASFSIPIFSLGILLVILLAVIPYQLHTTQGWTWLPYLPPGAVADVDNYGNFVNHLQHLVLPVTALALPQTAWLSRHVRFAMIEILKLDYIRTAWAKGLGARRIVLKHAFRNALLPLVTAVGLAAPQLIAGAILVENVFAYPGLGQLYFRALGGSVLRAQDADPYVLRPLDFPLALTLTFLMVVVVAVSNLLADLLYTRVDPRVTFATRRSL